MRPAVHPWSLLDSFCASCFVFKLLYIPAIIVDQCSCGRLSNYVKLVYKLSVHNQVLKSPDVLQIIGWTGKNSGNANIWTLFTKFNLFSSFSLGSKNDKKDEAIIENGDTIKAGTCSSDSVEDSTNGSLKNGKEEKEKDTEESENDHKMQQKEVKETSEGEQATNESEKNEEKIPNDEAIDDEEEEGDEDDEEDDDDEDDDDDDDDDDDEDGAPFQSSDEVSIVALTKKLS